MRRIFWPKRDEVTDSGENYIVRNLMICSPQPIFSGDKIEKNEVGGVCSAYGGGERSIHGFSGET